MLFLEFILVQSFAHCLSMKFAMLAEDFPQLLSPSYSVAFFSLKVTKPLLSQEDHPDLCFTSLVLDSNALTLFPFA